MLLHMSYLKFLKNKHGWMDGTSTYVDHERCDSVAVINNFRSHFIALVTFLLYTHAHTVIYFMVVDVTLPVRWVNPPPTRRGSGIRVSASFQFFRGNLRGNISTRVISWIQLHLAPSETAVRSCLRWRVILCFFAALFVCRRHYR